MTKAIPDTVPGDNDSARADWHERVVRSGISLEELAARTCVSYSLVYRMSKGTRRPSAAWLAVVDRVLAAGPWPRKEGGC